jgi:hypothetical protein
MCRTLSDKHHLPCRFTCSLILAFALPGIILRVHEIDSLALENWHPCSVPVAPAFSGTGKIERNYLRWSFAVFFKRTASKFQPFCLIFIGALLSNVSSSVRTRPYGSKGCTLREARAASWARSAFWRRQINCHSTIQLASTTGKLDAQNWTRNQQLPKYCVCSHPLSHCSRDLRITRGQAYGPTVTGQYQLLPNVHCNRLPYCTIHAIKLFS